ncbi:unnamed protein product [Vitrella brassicaformis CCMP3155]|uniref:Uncharacterized protein n=2 Tax=Vitrella brassicaformis TaxID=1169539 RepID=A0A0G4FB72_VITBC|nr:unnamed protein product [Vitrella brassicaformis CCMP3155]|eukprot:CEM10134.1 unnamed protein product [Vitrella brassicaformis CCMP3155]
MGRRGISRSADVKKQVHAGWRQGRSQKQLAIDFDLSESSVARYINQVESMLYHRKDESCLEPRKRSKTYWPGRGKSLDENALDIVKSLFESNPRLTIESVVDLLHNEYGYACSNESSISRFCSKRGFSIKKYKVARERESKVGSNDDHRHESAAVEVGVGASTAAAKSEARPGKREREPEVAESKEGAADDDTEPIMDELSKIISEELAQLAQRKKRQKTSERLHMHPPQPTPYIFTGSGLHPGCPPGNKEEKARFPMPAVPPSSSPLPFPLPPPHPNQPAISLSLPTSDHTTPTAVRSFIPPSPALPLPLPLPVPLPLPPHTPLTFHRTPIVSVPVEMRRPPCAAPFVFASRPGDGRYPLAGAQLGEMAAMLKLLSDAAKSKAAAASGGGGGGVPTEGKERAGSVAAMPLAQQRDASHGCPDYARSVSSLSTISVPRSCSNDSLPASFASPPPCPSHQHPDNTGTTTTTATSGSLHVLETLQSTVQGELVRMQMEKEQSDKGGKGGGVEATHGGGGGGDGLSSGSSCASSPTG